MRRILYVPSPLRDRRRARLETPKLRRFAWLRFSARSCEFTRKRQRHVDEDLKLLRSDREDGRTHNAVAPSRERLLEGVHAGVGDLAVVCGRKRRC